MARLFEQLGVSPLEQPLAADQFHLMARLRVRTTITLAVDEASVSPGDFFAHARAGLVDPLVVNLTRSGGLWPRLQQHSGAASAGKRRLAPNGSQFLDESALYPAKAAVEHHGSVDLDASPSMAVHPYEAQIRALALPAFAAL